MTSPTAVRAFAQMATEYERTLDGELRRFWGMSYVEFVDWFVGSVPLRAGDVILDLATGMAAIPRRLAHLEVAPLTVVGLDLTHEVLVRARESLSAGDGAARIELVCASAMAIPLPTASIDLALCALATHHMNARQLVAEMVRVLRPGGRLVLSDVAAAAMWGWPGVRWVLRAFAWAVFLPRSGVTRAWIESDAVSRIHTPNQWREILTEAGLVNVEVALPFGRRQPIGAPAPFRACAALPQSMMGG